MKSFSDLASLEGRVALVTGACGYLGQTVCKTLAELGAKLIITDTSECTLNILKEDLEINKLTSVNVKQCDLECPKSREKLISYVLKESSRLDILVNAAAFVSEDSIEGWTTNLENQTLETWRRAFEVNLTAIFDLSKSLAHKIAENNKGSIINIGSIYGSGAPDYSIYEGTSMGNPAAYAASKGGVVQLSRWLSTTVAPDVRVNTVSPGGIRRSQPESFIDKYEAKTPLGRMGTEEDFVGIIGYLASDLSSYVTGQNILVDGGWSVW
jgi:NAD(P)-dependent dehydrogenase (short-subunit alcohol dehydrogenase family)